jgi:SAM-dependent methyltransferase
MAHESLNYDYVLQRALSLSAAPNPDVLDFGCGSGKLLQMAVKQGFDGNLWGADSFVGFYKNWSKVIPEQVRARVRRIEDNRLPFDDASFDVVVSNQVFEHVFQPQLILPEINRVLRPGGTFLALFPTSDCWFEGHLGIYFVHWMSRVYRLQHAYCRLCRTLGYGYYTHNLSPKDWALRAQGVLRDVCIYHHVLDVRRWWKEAFGTEPNCLAEDYMSWRLERDPRLQRLKSLSRTTGGRALLRLICHKRAGRVLTVRKLFANKKVKKPESLKATLHV